MASARFGDKTLAVPSFFTSSSQVQENELGEQLEGPGVGRGLLSGVRWERGVGGGPVRVHVFVTNTGGELHHHRGRRETARELFAQIWDDIGGE